MNPICIIPARGGSKGLPRKNVLPLCGRPLLAWNILAALEACGAGNVFVTTDDSEIASVASRYGAQVINRPTDLSNDTATSESALIHALGEIKTRLKSLPELFVFLQCTSPLTNANDISQVVVKLQNNGFDCVFSAVRSHRFLWKQDSAGKPSGINHNASFRKRRQDMEPEYSENGAIYGMQTNGFLNNKNRFFGEIGIYEMPEERSWEIDSHTDFKIAESLLRNQLQARRMSLLPKSPSAVVFDFDGVMTDNRVTTDQNGLEHVTCDRSDGLGLAMLKSLGVPLLVLSTEMNPVVESRCKKLQIPCIHGSSDKASSLLKWSAEHAIDLERLVYLGNDRNDAGCMDIAGCPIAVADAYPEAKERALLVLERQGGKGAVRELCDMIVSIPRKQSHS